MKENKVKQLVCALLLGMVASILTGCATGSEDPHDPGIGPFPFPKEVYERRLQERRERLEAIRRGNDSLKSETGLLESDKATVLDEKRAVEQELHKLSSSISSLERSVKAKQARTAAQRKERQRILGELEKLRGSAKANSDNVTNPEDRRLQLERLQKRRQELEKEANNLMKL